MGYSSHISSDHENAQRMVSFFGSDIHDNENYKDSTLNDDMITDQDMMGPGPDEEDGDERH